MRLLCGYNRALKEVGGRRLPLSSSNRSGQTQKRHYSKPFDAAVIGGGITGLTAAFRLSQQENCGKVTVYEKSPRVGGWLQSEVVPADDGDVVFDYGPRTLSLGKLNSIPLINLVAALGLTDEVVATSKKSQSFLGRYIYYPDHLVRLPAPTQGNKLGDLWSVLRTIWSEPVFQTFLSSLFLEPLKAPRDYIKDESVSRFVSRRWHPVIADNLVSALYHGVYAGDVDKLSAQTLLGPYWDLEMRGDGITAPMLEMIRSQTKFMYMDDCLAITTLSNNLDKEKWKVLARQLKEAGVITFKRGLGQLVEALEASLKKSGKVEIHTNTRVTGVSLREKDSDLEVCFGEDEKDKYNNTRVHNRIIATAPAPELAEVLNNTSKPPMNTVRCLEEHDHAVSLMIVNLYYPDPDVVPVEGFGYLIPRSIPMEQNPERALGVIFGSQSSVGQDTASGTKITVMLGGHWWNDWDESDLPDHDTAVSMAQSLLERHLGIIADPLIARTKLQRNAIPQYPVGHLIRMHELSNAVREEFRHRLTLAGNWYGDAGVTDCIKQGYLAATFGVGAKRLSDPNDAGYTAFRPNSAPWLKYGYQNWDLEGGLVTSPVRWFEHLGNLRVNLNYTVQNE